MTCHDNSKSVTKAPTLLCSTKQSVVTWEIGSRVPNFGSGCCSKFRNLMSLRWSTAGGFEVGLEEAQFDLRNFEHFEKLWKASELGRFGDLSCQKPTGADDRDEGDGKVWKLTLKRIKSLSNYIMLHKINKLRLKLSCLAKPWPSAFVHGRPDRVAVKCAVTRTEQIC